MINLLKLSQYVIVCLETGIRWELLQSPKDNKPIGVTALAPGASRPGVVAGGEEAGMLWAYLQARASWDHAQMADGKETLQQKVDDLKKRLGVDHGD